jgi:hypothetical protein
MPSALGLGVLPGVGCCSLGRSLSPSLSSLVSSVSCRRRARARSTCCTCCARHCTPSDVLSAASHPPAPSLGLAARRGMGCTYIHAIYLLAQLSSSSLLSVLDSMSFQPASQPSPSGLTGCLRFHPISHSHSLTHSLPLSLPPSLSGLSVPLRARLFLPSHPNLLRSPVGTCSLSLSCVV